ncbi:phosphoesterase, PA-phosphatase related-family protein, partial [Reticulomyxa filosa]
STRTEITEKTTTQCQPLLHIVGYDGTCIHRDFLPIVGYERNRAIDYQLVWYPYNNDNNSESNDDDNNNSNNNNNNNNSSDNNSNGNADDTMKMNGNKELNEEDPYFIVSPNDIITASRYTIMDHLLWLWKRGRYDEAWKQALKHKNYLYLRSDIEPYHLGEFYLADILEQLALLQKKKQSIKAREHLAQHDSKSSHEDDNKKEAEYKHTFQHVCVQVFRDNKELWERWIKITKRQEQLLLLVPLLPTDKPCLSGKAYQTVLLYTLNNSPASFLQCIQAWPQTIYPIPEFISKTLAKYNGNKNNVYFIHALAELFCFVLFCFILFYFV